MALSTAQADGVDHKGVAAQALGGLDEGAMFEQHTDDVGYGQGRIECLQCSGAVLQFWRQFLDIGLHGHDLATQLGQVLSDFQGRAFAQIINVGFEGQAKTGNSDIRQRAAGLFGHGIGDGGLDLFNHPFGLVVVDLAGGADQSGLFRAGLDDEPGVNRDTVPANAGAGLQDVDPRVAVGQTDELPDVDVELVADQGEFVGKGDVDVAEAVFCQLGQLGRARGGGDAFALDEDAIEIAGCFGAFGRHAADDAIVLDQLTNDMAGQHALRAVGDADIGTFAMGLREGQVRAGFGQPFGHLFGGTDWAGGLQHHEVAGSQHGGQRLAGGLNVAEIGLGWLAVFAR